MLLAQLTDTHVVDPRSDEELHVDNNGRLAEAVASLNAEPVEPAAVLATGDLVNWGHQPEYDELARLVEGLKAPLLPLPGNHDDRARIRATFPNTPWADTEHASWQTRVGDVAVIGLDSTVPGQPGAEFDDAREAWLSAALGSAGEGQILLALHHPPFTTGIAAMDRAGFIGLDRLLNVLAEHGNVDRVVCGHLHRPISSVVAGIPAQVGLSTVQHVGLDLRPEAGFTIVKDPVGYMLHGFTNNTWVTHTRYIATGQQPFVPDWARSDTP